MQRTDWSAMSLRGLVVIAIIVTAGFFAYFAIPLVYPFIIGWLIAMSIEPSVRWLEVRAKTPRWVSVTIILIFVISLLFFLVFFLAAELVIELTHLAEFLPSFIQKIGQQFLTSFTSDSNVSRLIDTIQSYLEKNPHHKQQITNSLQDNLVGFANKGTLVITSILSSIGATLSNLPFFLTVLVFITLSAFFMGFRHPHIREGISTVTPVRVKETVGMVLFDIKKALFGFMRAQLILISITAVLMFIGLLILRVPYAFTIALLIGLSDLLPYVGVGIIVIPWISYLFLIDNVELAIGLSVVYGILIIVRQIMEPRLVASNIGLDPLLTLIALFVGLQLFGFLGLILGPVILVIGNALYRANFFRDLWRFITTGSSDGVTPKS